MSSEGEIKIREVLKINFEFFSYRAYTNFNCFSVWFKSRTSQGQILFCFANELVFDDNSYSYHQNYYFSTYRH